MSAAVFIAPRRRAALRNLALRLAKDRQGMAAVEFAMAAPVLILLLCGIFDIGHMAYVNAVLHGAVEDAARNGTLEMADTTTLDQKILAVVGRVAPGATVSTTRSSYYDFTDIARPEAWNDKNNNGTCDNNEAYVDENKNGRWDADVGQSGNGGPNDVVLYTVKATYKPLFPIPGLTNPDQTRTLTATTVRKNQPYGQQADYGTAAGVCK
ncbi:TadE/TadG family type IV pilus assembly protein [Novosphingobium sp. BL-8H]|uniref:TadE/TadG family type IV pilus assembly protein n=1 Tax=Novosphingobium sp. BL-8H TaxID=3127640 RepID=UPI003757E04D